MNRIINVIDGINEWIGRGVAWCALAMVLLTFGVVVLRYVFGIGSIALQESVVYLHAAVFMLGAAYTLKHDAHVRVDVFYHRLAPRGRAIVNLAGVLLLLFPVAALLFFVSLDYVANAWAVREASREPGGLPWVYLLKTLIPAAAVLIFLQGISQLLRALRVIKEGQ
jgi:TRAP-type mannitol/chloroaromatic compound transport system permease small subunit